MKKVMQQIQHCRESKETLEQNLIIIIPSREISAEGSFASF